MVAGANARMHRRPNQFNETVVLLEGIRGLAECLFLGTQVRRRLAIPELARALVTPHG